MNVAEARKILEKYNASHEHFTDEQIEVIMNTFWFANLRLRYSFRVLIDEIIGGITSGRSKA